MFKKPEPASLLSIASETFATEILPYVPPDKRYVAAMVANAMAISARQLDEPRNLSKNLTENQLLDTVYGEDCGLSWERFADDLRSGVISEQTHPDLLDGMMESLRNEIAVSNPKFQE